MPESDLDLLLHGAIAASDIALKYFQHNPEVWEKDAGAGPVSQADLEIDALLTREFRSARPNYGWLSEET